MPLRSAASLICEALEAVSVSHVFSVPAPQHQDLHDELDQSAGVRSVLVGHEAAGVFMADGVSRNGTSLGALMVAPTTGVTPAFTGLAQAFSDGVPLLVICLQPALEAVHQLPGMGPQNMLQFVTKGSWQATRHEDVIPMLYEAVRQATSGKPGPVWVDIQLPCALGLSGHPAPWHAVSSPPPKATQALARLATACLTQARDKKQAKALHPAESLDSVTPSRLVQAVQGLQAQRRAPATVVMDDPRANLLTAHTEHAMRSLASAIQFSGTGYGVAAAIGAKLAQPALPVVALVGESGFRMTALELVTAVDQELGMVVLVLTQALTARHVEDSLEGRAGLNALELEGVAQATGATFLRMHCDAKIKPVMAQAWELAQDGCVVLVDVSIDCATTEASQPALAASQVSAISQRQDRLAASATGASVTQIASRRRVAG